MAERIGTVRLIAPNGQTVSVAESKKEERLAAGYQLPRKRRAQSVESDPTGQ